MKISVLNRTLVESMSVLVLTVIHHIYGAVIYNSPFRLHIVFFVLPGMAVYFFVYGLYRRSQSKWYGTVSLWLFKILTLAIPVGMLKSAVLSQRLLRPTYSEVTPKFSKINW